MERNINYLNMLPVALVGLVAVVGGMLAGAQVSANDVVDDVEITVPLSCTMSGSGMGTHTGEIANGAYVNDIGTTTMHIFCNDNAGFSLYAIGYTDDTLGNNALSDATLGSDFDIATGIATSAGNPDVSN